MDISGAHVHHAYGEFWRWWACSGCVQGGLFSVFSVGCSGFVQGGVLLCVFCGGVATGQVFGFVDLRIHTRGCMYVCVFLV